MKFVDINEMTTIEKVNKYGSGIQLFMWSMEIK